MTLRIMKIPHKIPVLAAVLAALCVPAPQAGAQTVRMTLEEAIIRARTHSVDAQVAANAFKSAYWSFRTYKAGLLPEVGLRATLPSFSKSYSPYQLDDGSYTFVRNNNLEMSAQVSVSQAIWPTGGTLSLTTSADFMRTLQAPTANRFMSIPVALTLSQPVFAANAVKWNRRIEPVRYEEAKAAFIEATEQVAMMAINNFFNLLYACENTALEEQNLSNAAKLYEVALAKREMGRISRNDLLQLELNKIQAEANLTDARSEMQNHMFRLVAFLDLPDGTEIKPVMPGRIPATELQYGEVQRLALDNNSLSKNLRRRQLEADYAVATAKGNLRSVTLYAQVGLTGTDNTFGAAYRNLRNNQVVEVGIDIPLIDWGKRRGQVKVAQSNRELTQAQLRREAMTFNQDLFVLVGRFNNQARQLEMAQRADTIADTRWQTNYQTFMVGKISTLDLNDSNTAKAQARLKVISELFNYWYYYYQIRSLTLWDFNRGCGIDADFDAMVRN